MTEDAEDAATAACTGTRARNAASPKSPSATPGRQAHRPPGSGKTKTEARAKLKEVCATTRTASPSTDHALTVADGGRGLARLRAARTSANTVDKYTILCQHAHHPAPGRAQAAGPDAPTDVDRWLADKAKILSTRTLRDLRRASTGLWPAPWRATR